MGWYQGRIQRIYHNGQVRIQYDDGDVWTGPGAYVYLVSGPMPPTAVGVPTGFQISAPPPSAAVVATGDRPVCPVCLVHEMNVALGCGHRVCSSCLPALMARPTQECPVCRTAIGMTLPIYN